MSKFYLFVDSIEKKDGRITVVASNGGMKNPCLIWSVSSGDAGDIHINDRFHLTVEKSPEKYDSQE